MARRDATKRPFVRAAARLLRRVADLVPITPLGLFVAIGAEAARRYLAYAKLDLIWLVVSYAALGFVAVALLMVVVGAVALKFATRVRAHGEIARRTMETGRSLPTGFTAPSLFFLPLLQIDWRWEQPEEATVTVSRARFGVLKEDVELRERGHVHGLRRRIVVQDALGLARLAIRQHDPVELTVLPHVGKLGEAPLLVSLSGGDERPHPMGVEDGDRVELRRYAPGDPARFIHWKVFGRTRRLMVRMPERALSPARRTVAYQVAGSDDDASAAAARVAIEARALGTEWSFSADGASGDTSRTDEAIEMIVRSREARGIGGTALSSFLQRAERAGPASAVLFVPPRPGSWLDPVVSAVKPRAPRTRIVIAVDGIDRRGPARWWRRALTLPGRREGTPAEDLDAVLRALSATRAEVIVLDRKSGRRMGAAHRAAMKRLVDEREEQAA